MSEGSKKFFNGCLVASFMFVVVLLLGTVLSFVGCGMLVSGIGKTCEERLARSDSAWVDDEDMNRGSCAGDDAPRVLHIILKGEISSETEDDIFGLHDDTGAPFALLQVREATDDPFIDGIFLDVDSPGGEVTMSDDLWAALNEFRESGENRRVVAFFGSSACSGAYYASACADRIVARPTTITGSIGVKIESFNLKQLAERIGVRPVSVTSGENKNILSPFEDMTAEQRAIVSGVVEQMHDRFVQVVAAGRGMDEAKVRELADGRIYTAKDALAAGLIDSIGYLGDAKAAVSAAFGAETDAYYLRAVPPQHFLDILGTSGFLGSCARRAASAAVDGALSESSRPRFSY